MSRCFPFPPPGYTLNKIGEEAVIESIKGAEEKAKKEQRRKERKREKKEKREKKKRERKDGESKGKREKKEKKGKEGDSEKRHHKRRRRSKEEGAKDDQNEKKVDVFSKLKESVSECLEKSSLTVERDLLQSTSQDSCDSTLNSNEKLPKLNEKQPLNGRHNNDSESAIRIRLPIRRQNDSKVMMKTNKDQQQPCPSQEIKLVSSLRSTGELLVNQHPCSTSAPEHALEQCNNKKRKDTKLASEPSHKKKRKLGEEKISSLSAIETYQPSSLCTICPPSLAMQFLNVVENWVPKTIERRIELTNSEDEECWWVSKKPSNPTFERCKQLDNENKQVSSSSMDWPCARLLPEADVYALPYTVPF